MAVQEALREAVIDEFRNGLYYDAMMERFGRSRRLARLREAEDRHAGALLTLCHRYGVETPRRQDVDAPSVPPTRREAILAAIEGEAANVAMFDRLLKSVEHADVAAVFRRLRDVSRHHHLPALRRAL